jgi:hypothetical protein
LLRRERQLPPNLNLRPGSAALSPTFSVAHDSGSTAVRFYDPGTGQFISRDPIEALTREAYGYVGGNPLNATDPTGRCSVGAFVTSLFEWGQFGPDSCEKEAGERNRQAIGGAIAYYIGLQMLWGVSPNGVADGDDWQCDITFGTGAFAGSQWVVAG